MSPASAPLEDVDRRQRRWRRPGARTDRPPSRAAGADPRRARIMTASRPGRTSDANARMPCRTMSRKGPMLPLVSIGEDGREGRLTDLQPVRAALARPLPGSGPSHPAASRRPWVVPRRPRSRSESGTPTVGRPPNAISMPLWPSGTSMAYQSSSTSISARSVTTSAGRQRRGVLRAIGGVRRGSNSMVCRGADHSSGPRGEPCSPFTKDGPVGLVRVRTR